MQRTFFTRTAAVVLSLATAAGTAQAQDRLNFEGNFGIGQSGGGSSIFIDFLTNGTTPGAPTGTVMAIQTISGAFMPGIMVGTQGVITDHVATMGGFTVPAPGGTALVIGGYTFTLTGAAAGNTFGPISLFGTGTGTILAFATTGQVTGGAFGADARTYNAIYTAQFAGETPAQLFNAITAGAVRTVAFSAEIVVTPPQVIPEPSTYALMASGLGALGIMARRRRQA